MEGKQGPRKLAERSYLLISLTLGLLGYIVLLDYSRYNLHLAQIIIGFSLLAISVTLGAPQVQRLFAKQVGPYTDIYYLKIVIIFTVAAARIIMSFLNIEMLESASYTSMITLSLFLQVLVISGMLMFSDSMQPHSSYMVKREKSVQPVRNLDLL